MVLALLRIRTHKYSLGVWETNWSYNLDKTTSLSDCQIEKKRTYLIEDFAVPAEHRVKLKENEKRDKYLDLARELNNYGKWKWLNDLQIREGVETFQTTELLKSARILRRVLETCCHSNSSGKPSANIVVRTLKSNKYINKNNNWEPVE